MLMGSLFFGVAFFIIIEIFKKKKETPPLEQTSEPIKENQQQNQPSITKSMEQLFEKDLKKEELSYTESLEKLFQEKYWKEKISYFQKPNKFLFKMPRNKNGDYNNHLYHFNESLKDNDNPWRIVYHVVDAIRFLESLLKARPYNLAMAIRQKKENSLSEEEFLSLFFEVGTIKQPFRQINEHLTRLYILLSYAQAKIENYEKSRISLDKAINLLEEMNNDDESIIIMNDLDFWRDVVPKYLQSIKKLIPRPPLLQNKINEFPLTETAL